MIKPIIAICSFFAVYAILTTYRGMPVDHDHALMFIIAQDESVNDANNYAGITQKKWEIWRSKQGDIRHLPRYVRELPSDPKLNPLKDPKVDITIIKRYYYDTLQRRWHAWDIHPAFQLIYADFVTLVGREAVKEVQKLVGVEPDGQWGMGTAAAVKKFNADFEAKRTQNPDYAWKVFLQFDAQKRAVFQALAKKAPEKYASHLQKWLKRSDALKTYMQPVLTGKK